MAEIAVVGAWVKTVWFKVRNTVVAATVTVKFPAPVVFAGSCMADILRLIKTKSFDMRLLGDEQSTGLREHAIHGL